MPEMSSLAVSQIGRSLCGDYDGQSPRLSNGDRATVIALYVTMLA